MELQQALNRTILELPEERLRELLRYARFLAHCEEEQEWRSYGREQFSRAYGSDEPEYTEADLKSTQDGS